MLECSFIQHEHEQLTKANQNPYIEYNIPLHGIMKWKILFKISIKLTEKSHILCLSVEKINKKIREYKIWKIREILYKICWLVELNWSNSLNLSKLSSFYCVGHLKYEKQKKLPKM